MFRVYKPKGHERVKADQVTKENAQDLANSLFGRVVRKDTNNRDEKGDIVVTGIEFPTLDGVKGVDLDWWIIRKEDNTFETMSDEQFRKSYEVARNTIGG